MYILYNLYNVNKNNPTEIIMSFTWFSTLLFLIILSCVGFGVIRGMRRGLIRSSISVAVLLISAVLAGLIAMPVSDLPADLIYDVFIRATRLVDTYQSALPSVGTLVYLAIDALLTPFIFVVLFPIIRLILSIIFKLVCRCALRSYSNSSFTSPDPASSPSYEGRNAPFHVRHDRTLGGIVGGLCTFLTAIIVTSPLVGTLTMAADLNRNLQRNNVDWSTIGIEDSFISDIDTFFNDGGVAILNASGAGFVFRATAVSTIPEGTNISLPHEAEAISSFVPNIIKLFNSFGDNDRFPSANEIDSVIKTLEDSELLKTVAKDVITSASQAWLRGDSYLGIERPSSKNYFDSIIIEILKVCATSNQQCVATDLRTLFNIYSIMLDNGAIDPTLTRPQLEELLARDGFISAIKQELSNNPCMSGLVDKIADTSLHILSSMVINADLSSPEAQEFMQNVCDQYNDIISRPGFDITDQKESMAKSIREYAAELGVELPPDVTEMTIDSLLRRLDGKSNLTPAELERLFEDIKNESGITDLPIQLPDDPEITVDSYYETVPVPGYIID